MFSIFPFMSSISHINLKVRRCRRVITCRVRLRGDFFCIRQADHRFLSTNGFRIFFQGDQTFSRDIVRDTFLRTTNSFHFVFVGLTCRFVVSWVSDDVRVVINFGTTRSSTIRFRHSFDSFPVFFCEGRNLSVSFIVGMFHSFLFLFFGIVFRDQYGFWVFASGSNYRGASLPFIKESYLEGM